MVPCATPHPTLDLRCERETAGHAGLHVGRLVATGLRLYWRNEEPESPEARQARLDAVVAGLQALGRRR